MREPILILAFGNTAHPLVFDLVMSPPSGLAPKPALATGYCGIVIREKYRLIERSRKALDIVYLGLLLQAISLVFQIMDYCNRNTRKG